MESGKSNDFAMPTAPDPPRPLVFLDITIDGANAGRLQFELCNDLAPMAAENFRALCTGEKGRSRNGTRMHYKGTDFYRIRKGAFLSGGDIVNGNGTGGESIFAGRPFLDDDNNLKHVGIGVLSTAADTEKNMNDSRFNITLANVDWLDKKCVVFGRLIHGTTCLMEMEAAAGTDTGEPRARVSIVDCGELKNEHERHRRQNH